MRKCASQQKSNYTPEKVAEMKARSERQRRIAHHSRAAKSMQMSNAMVQKSYNMASKKMSTPMAPTPGGVFGAPMARAERSLMMQESVREATMQMEVLESASKAWQGGVSANAEEGLEEAEEQLEAMTSQLDMDLGRVDSDVGIEGIEAEGQAEFMELLEGLRMEPQDDDESTAKFQLFETFMGTVEKLRNETVDFYEECKADFAAETQRGVARQIHNIDDERNMGVEFVEGRWMVYDMTRKAGQNSAMIGAILGSIKTKLDLLSRQDECPMCLDALDEGAHVLGCCHKVCVDCWENWKEMQGGGAFCPLCRQEDFLGEFMQRAEAEGIDVTTNAPGEMCRAMGISI